MSLPSFLTDSQQEKFLVLLSHYEDVLTKCPEDLGCTDVLSHYIKTGNARPIRQQAW